MNSAANQARITTINSELRRLNTNLDDVNISLNHANTKLETLTTARNQLNTLLDNYFRFPTDYSNIGSSIWDNQFRGSLRLDVRVHLQVLIVK